MAKFTVECGLISKLLETKDYALLKELQIKSKFFSGEHRKVYNYITDYFSRNGEVPTVRAVKKKFRDYDIETYFIDEEREVYGTEEPLKYWCDELRAKVKHNTIAENTEKIVELLEDKETDKAYNLFRKTITVVENEIVESTTTNLSDTASRKEAYLKRKENKGIIGISTGIDKLDYYLKGLQNGTLTTLIAKTGVGKTWLEVLLGSHACLNGYRVAQFLTEMSEEQMRDRYEAMLFGIMIGDFSYERFKSGSLYPDEEQAYFDFLDNTLPRLEPVLFSDADSVSSILAFLDTNDIDLVLIDGAYLMEDDQGAESDWLRIAHITRDLKKLVAHNRKKPVFINSQADSNTSTKTGPELENIGFSKAIGHDSDNVLALFQDPQMKLDREMKIRVLKNREGVTGNILMNWDFSVMNFSPIFDEKDDKEFDDKSTFVSIEDTDEED